MQRSAHVSSMAYLFCTLCGMKRWARTTNSFTIASLLLFRERSNNQGENKVIWIRCWRTPLIIYNMRLACSVRMHLLRRHYTFTGFTEAIMSMTAWHCITGFRHLRSEVSNKTITSQDSTFWVAISCQFATSRRSPTPWCDVCYSICRANHST